MRAESARFARYRWTGFTLLALTFVLGFFHRIAPGVVAPDLMASFGISAAALGSLAGTYYYVYTAMQIPSGIMSDTLGPRYSVSAAGLIAAAGAIVFGLADDFATATLGRLMVGFGVSFTFVGLMKFNTLWFPENRYGMISGLTLLIGNTGAVLAASPLALVLAFASWREVFVGVGVFGLIMALLTVIFLRNHPHDVGLPDLQGEHAKPKASQRHWSREMYGALTNPHVWPGFVLMFGTTGTVLAFVGLWCVPLMQDLHGLGRTSAAGYSTVMLLGTAVGAFFVGSLTDRLGHRKPMAIISAGLAVLCWLALLYLPWQPGWSAYLILGFLGLCAGGGTIAYAIGKEVAPPLFSGMAISVVNTGLFLGAAVAQPLYGWAMDWLWQGELIGGLRIYEQGDHARGLWLCAVLAMLSFGASLLLKETHCRNISLPSASG